jgi:hypothetical protein
MMRKLISVAGLIGIFFNSYAQQPAALPANLSLDDRYIMVKGQAQTYQDYKVIKEYALDGLWKIAKDSVNKAHDDLDVAKARISQLQNDVVAAKNNLQQKELSTAGIVYESTHISALGIPFTKGIFLGTVAVITGGLIVVLLVLLALLRMVRGNLKERAFTVDLLTKEFDEYKKKALDKETKILRQLQDERNRYHASPR